MEFREGKDGINNLLNIYCAVTGTSIEDAVNQFRDGGYGKFKMAVGEAVVETLRPIQEKVKDKSVIVPRIYTNKARTTGIA